jgi:hypothetical protein
VLESPVADAAQLADWGDNEPHASPME